MLCCYHTCFATSAILHILGHIFDLAHDKLLASHRKLVQGLLAVL